MTSPRFSLRNWVSQPDGPEPVMTGSPGDFPGSSRPGSTRGRGPGNAGAITSAASMDAGRPRRRRPVKGGPSRYQCRVVGDRGTDVVECPTARKTEGDRVVRDRRRPAPAATTSAGNRVPDSTTIRHTASSRRLVSSQRNSSSRCSRGRRAVRWRRSRGRAAAAARAYLVGHVRELVVFKGARPFGRAEPAET